MVRLQKLFLSLIIIFCLFSCKKQKEQAKEILEFGKYYQGSAQSLNALSKSVELDSTNAEAYRELSIPYLKRGIPHLWKKHMEKAIQKDPISWQGYRGYNYLWFYRDYKKAIADFDATDTLTPNFIDYPQGHSVDYWRGIAYLGLGNYEKSIAYWNKHIKKETEDTGEDWVEINAFLYRGIAYYESKNYELALRDFNKIIYYFKQSADAKYYKAIILYEKGNKNEAQTYIEEAIKDFKLGFYNQRPYVETLRQIYMEDLLLFKKKLFTS